MPGNLLVHHKNGFLHLKRWRAFNWLPLRYYVLTLKYRKLYHKLFHNVMKSITLMLEGINDAIRLQHFFSTSSYSSLDFWHNFAVYFWCFFSFSFAYFILLWCYSGYNGWCLFFSCTNWTVVAVESTYVTFLSLNENVDWIGSPWTGWSRYAVAYTNLV